MLNYRYQSLVCDQFISNVTINNSTVARPIFCAILLVFGNPDELRRNDSDGDTNQSTTIPSSIFTSSWQTSPSITTHIQSQSPTSTPPPLSTTVPPISDIPIKISRQSIGFMINRTTIYKERKQKKPPYACEQIRQERNRGNGVYYINLFDYGNFFAYCNMDVDQGWMVLQRRSSSSISFWDMSFDKYSNGFGDPTGDHWLGLDRIFSLQRTSKRPLQMKIELFGDFCQGRACSRRKNDGYWWGIWNFTISDREHGFRLQNLALVSGNLSNPASPEKDVFRQLNNNQRFTTTDVDNDNVKELNCASHRKQGGWWHKDCTLVALNGHYGSENGLPEGQFWHMPPERDEYFSLSYNIKPMKSRILVSAI